MKAPKYIDEILKTIYNDIYIKISTNTIHCFLCGAANSKDDKPVLREQLKDYLEKNSDIKILYAEQLFKRQVNVKSENNFLYLENLLADNADVVIIVLESPGAFVELGAFSNRDNLKEKLIVLMDKFYKDDESFINLGPVKMLKRQRNKSVLYYDNEIDREVAGKVKRSINEYLQDKEISLENDLTSIISMYYFLQLYLYFFSPVTFGEISKHMEIVSKKRGNELNDQISSSLELLYNEGIAKRDKTKFYILTEKGYQYVKENLLRKRLKDKYLFDKLRLAILNHKLRIKPDNYIEYCS